jgi:hypothetical protein
MVTGGTDAAAVGEGLDRAGEGKGEEYGGLEGEHGEWRERGGGRREREMEWGFLGFYKRGSEKHRHRRDGKEDEGPVGPRKPSSAALCVRMQSNLAQIGPNRPSWRRRARFPQLSHASCAKEMDAAKKMQKQPLHPRARLRGVHLHQVQARRRLERVRVRVDLAEEHHALEPARLGRDPELAQDVVLGHRREALRGPDRVLVAPALQLPVRLRARARDLPLQVPGGTAAGLPAPAGVVIAPTNAFTSALFRSRSGISCSSEANVKRWAASLNNSISSAKTA